MSKVLTAIAVIETKPVPAAKEVNFPVLAKHAESGLIVLFTSPTEGTVLIERGVVCGKHVKNWGLFYDRKEWTLLKPGASVILRNSEE